MDGRFARWMMALVLTSAIVGEASAVSRETQPAAEPGYALYASDSDVRRYQQVDPLTLDPLPGEPLAVESEFPNLTASADGSTSAMIDSTKLATLEGWIVVYDGLLERTRLSIDVDREVYGLHLSADGSRLVGRTQWTCGPYGCEPLTWYTWGARNGDLISVTSADLGDYVGEPMLTPAVDRLYIGFHERPPRPGHLATPVPTGSRDTGPWPLRIAAFDLTSGEEIGRMTVTDVMAGSWQVEPIDTTYTGELLMPGIALSPDGATIAVVDAAMETLTLIDAETLTANATRVIHERESATSSALRWLGILPETAQAKVAEGRSVSATFSADGEELYLTGEEIEVGETVEDVTGRGFGLVSVDILSGEITGRSLDGHDLSTILPSPEGRTVYVMHEATPWWESDGGRPTFVLRRLDSDSLESMARRELDGWAMLLLVPGGEPG